MAAPVAKALHARTRRFTRTDARFESRVCAWLSWPRSLHRTHLRAADLYWDINGSTAGLGGTGIWNLSNLFWGTNSNGTTGPYSGWNNLALDNAFFAGTAGTLTLGAPITVHDMNFLVAATRSVAAR